MTALIRSIGLRMTKSPELELSPKEHVLSHRIVSRCISREGNLRSRLQQPTTPTAVAGSAHRLKWPNVGGGGCSPPHHPSPRSSPHPCSRIHPGQGSSMPGLFISLVSRETFWQSLAGNVISLPLHVPTGTEMQGSLNICFLNLGNSRSLLPCNTQSVSFIKSCPGKCLIHSCRRPTVGRARAFKTLGGGRQ